MSEAPFPIVSRDLDGGDGTGAINAAEQRNPTNDSSNNPARSKGWLMVSLVFIANFLVFGFFKSLGMLTKILNKEFDATMNVYILMCITYSLNCAAGPLSCYLTRRYSARTMALVGTSLVTFGLILSWFAQSLTFLYFSVGMLTGIGSGLTYPTGVILVSNYFAGSKNAAIANALVVSGSPIGGMIMPFVISFLSELYTSRGAFLIVGGFMFHAILCARSFRQPAESKTNSVVVTDHIAPTSPSQDGHESCAKSEDLQTCDDENNVISPKVHSCSTGILTLSGKHGLNCRDCGTTASVQTVRGFRTCHSVHSPSFSIRESNTNEFGVANDSAHGLTYRRQGATNMLNRNTLGVRNSSNRNTPQAEVVPATGSQPYILALDHSCIILCPSNTDVILKQKNPQFVESAKSVNIGGGTGDNEGSNGENGENSNTNQPADAIYKPARKTWKFVSPLGNPIYIFLLLSNTATAISTANIYLMVSQLVEESNDDYAKTSLLYLLISFADLTGRIVGAFLCDKKIMSSSAIYAIGLVSAGISSSLLASFTSFVYLCTGAFVYGLSSGFHVGIYGLLLTSIVGIKNIHAGYGISMFVNGTIQCAAILLSGSMISMYTSSFVWLSPVFGGILMGGGFLWIFGSLLFKMKTDEDDRNLQNQEDDAVNNNVNPDPDI